MKRVVLAGTVAFAVVSAAWAGAQFTSQQAVDSINEGLTYFVGQDHRYSEKATLMWPIGYRVTTHTWTRETSMNEGHLASHIVKENHYLLFSSRDDRYPNPKPCVLGFCPPTGQ